MGTRKNRDLFLQVGAIYCGAALIVVLACSTVNGLIAFDNDGWICNYQSAPGNADFVVQGSPCAFEFNRFVQFVAYFFGVTVIFQAPVYLLLIFVNLRHRARGAPPLILGHQFWRPIAITFAISTGLFLTGWIGFQVWGLVSYAPDAGYCDRILDWQNSFLFTQSIDCRLPPAMIIFKAVKMLVLSALTLQWPAYLYFWAYRRRRAAPA